MIENYSRHPLSNDRFSANMLRFIPILVLTFLGMLSASAADDLQSDISTQAKAARAILDAYHAENPRKSERTLHLVYWSPSDREPAEAYRDRLTRIFEDIQKFYATEMERIGFGSRTIQLDYAEDKMINIHLVQGARPFADYGMQDGSKIRKECVPTLRKAGIDPDRETIVIFCNMANWDEEKKIFTHNSPYYAGGNAGHGTAWQLDSPELDTKNLPLKEPMIRDGQYGRISLGKHNSIFIGGIAHELGHALGLPHNRERPDERTAFGTALMGSGNRSYGDELRGEGKGSFLTLAHAMRLASHPQFSGSIKNLYAPSRAKFSEFQIKTAENSFTVSGKVKSATPVYGIVAYMDPAGGSDYDATTTTAVPDASGNFTLDCNALRKGKPAQLNLIACMANGATHRHSFSYQVDGQGKPDLSSLQLKLALAPIIAGLNARNAEIGKKIDALENSRAKEIALRIAKPTKRRAAPSSIDDKIVPLADTTPSVEKVGWGRPAYNRLPRSELILEAAGEIFATGIYAHAPAAHHYDLDGKWKTLTGKCGIAAGSRGSVVFVIKADGKEKWRSPVTKAGQLQPYNIDLSGVGELELIVEDAGDGTGSDWGLWLDPILSK
ncbi:MAG: hypothetical protein ACI8XO_001213 [Verrucomicrobiales bacterium]|jgi:hypothetical protein